MDSFPLRMPDTLPVKKTWKKGAYRSLLGCQWPKHLSANASEACCYFFSFALWYPAKIPIILIPMFQTPPSICFLRFFYPLFCHVISILFVCFFLFLCFRFLHSKQSFAFQIPKTVTFHHSDRLEVLELLLRPAPIDCHLPEAAGSPVLWFEPRRLPWRPLALYWRPRSTDLFQVLQIDLTNKSWARKHDILFPVDSSQLSSQTPLCFCISIAPSKWQPPPRGETSYQTETTFHTIANIARDL